jgi:hypothetical protein
MKMHLQKRQQVQQRDKRKQMKIKLPQNALLVHRVNTVSPLVSLFQSLWVGRMIERAVSLLVHADHWLFISMRILVVRRHDSDLWTRAKVEKDDVGGVVSDGGNGACDAERTVFIRSWILDTKYVPSSIEDPMVRSNLVIQLAPAIFTPRI